MDHATADFGFLGSGMYCYVQRGLGVFRHREDSGENNEKLDDICVGQQQLHETRLVLYLA